MSSELEFLQNYYEFFSKKDSSIENFKKAVKNSLVNTGQIQIETLTKFCAIISIDQQIEEKKNEIKKLEEEIKTLNKKKPRTVIGTSYQEPDPCSKPRHSQRNGC